MFLLVLVRRSKKAFDADYVEAFFSKNLRRNQRVHSGVSGTMT